jgi:hypothetical protein
MHLDIDKTLRDIMEAIPNIPYAEMHPVHRYAIGSGCSKDIAWNGSTLLRSTVPPTCHCVGIVFEYLVDVFKAFGKETQIPRKPIRELLRRTMLDKTDLEKHGYDMSEDSSVRWGAPQALIDYGWAYEVENPEDALVGDICQLWNWKDEGKSKRTWGHCMILTGELDERDNRGKVVEEGGRTCLLSMGATVKRGYAKDYHYLFPNNSHREFKIARLDEDWLSNEDK